MPRRGRRSRAEGFRASETVVIADTNGSAEIGPLPLSDVRRMRSRHRSARVLGLSKRGHGPSSSAPHSRCCRTRVRGALPVQPLHPLCRPSRPAHWPAKGHPALLVEEADIALPARLDARKHSTSRRRLPAYQTEHPQAQRVGPCLLSVDLAQQQGTARRSHWSMVVIALSGRAA